MLNVGQLVEKRYKVLEILGSGGMSNVYLVYDLRLDNKWVLKEFLGQGEDQQETEVLQEHFKNEAQLLARISHPNLPRVIDYFSHGQIHYLVEEFVDGTTLLEIVNKGKLPVKRVIPVAMQLAETLVFLHNQGIVYRDLKPDNVMVEPLGTIKLIDFGIARIYKAGKMQDTIVMGTPGYAPPEQYGTSQTDVRADVYSLGALLHHLVTGKDPRENPFNFDPPSALNIVIPTYLESVIMKALSMKAEDRYPNMKAMRESLELVREEVSGVSPRKNAEGEGNSTLPDNDKTYKSTLNSRKQKALKTYQASNQGVHTRNNEAKKNDTNPLNKVQKIIFTIVFFMILALFIEIEFGFTVLIPFFVVATLVVTWVSFSLWVGPK
ncbi:MAG: serine/threonine protein kinase [Vulcanimicrobiota bacterium]